MLAHNLTIHGLWIGERLSLMEQLTLRSFLACGHRFVLWLYGPLQSDLPEGVEVRDATEIISQERVFCYESGLFPGSYGGFSDLFRYKLLHEHGGWWTDMDVACLRPLDFDQPYAFHPHSGLGLVGTVLKAPSRSELMLRCYSWTDANVNAQNTDWLKPIQVLVAEARRLQLCRYILPPDVALADWRDGANLATTATQPPAGLHLIHWCNEWLKAHAFDKNEPMPGTTFHRLLRQHGLTR